MCVFECLCVRVCVCNVVLTVTYLRSQTHSECLKNVTLIAFNTVFAEVKDPLYIKYLRIRSQAFFWLLLGAGIKHDATFTLISLQRGLTALLYASLYPNLPFPLLLGGVWSSRS